MVTLSMPLTSASCDPATKGSHGGVVAEVPGQVHDLTLEPCFVLTVGKHIT